MARNDEKGSVMGHMTSKMGRIASCALACVLAWGLLPIFPLGATEGYAEEPQFQEASVDSSAMTAAEAEARAQELIAAGSYAEGRVLVQVTDEFEMIAPLSADATDGGSGASAGSGETLGSVNVESLYTFSDPETVAENSADEKIAALCAEAEVSGEEPDAAELAEAREADAPARVVLVTSETATTEELLTQLLQTPGVVKAEPDYVGTIEDEIVTPDQDDAEEVEALAASSVPDAAGATGVSGNDASDGSARAQIGEGEATASDPLLADQWQLASSEEYAAGTNVQELWSKLNYTSSATVPENEEVVVAVVDTGVDYTNPDLKNVMWDGGYELAERYGNGKKYGYAPLTEDGDPMDDDGHGTHVAGIIAAELGNGEGGAGMAPNARIMALRVADEKGFMLNSAMVLSYDYMSYAASEGVNIVAANNSYGGPLQGNDILTDVMHDLYVTYGVITVVAAGNSYWDNDVVSQKPASLTSNGGIIVLSLDSDGNPSYYTDYGTQSTDIGAPGDGILSTVTESESAAMLSDELLQDTYSKSGEGAPTGPFAFTAVVPDETYESCTVAQAEEAAAGGEGDSGVKWVIPRGESRCAIETQPVNVTEESGAAKDGAYAIVFRARIAEAAEQLIGTYLRAWVYTKDRTWMMLDDRVAAMRSPFQILSITLSESEREAVDWSNFKLRLTCAEHAKGDIVIYIDDMTLVGEDAIMPYAYYDGTSMASPMVAGALAVARVAYPNDSPSQLRARVLGAAHRTDALEGLCTTDGQLDLSPDALDDPAPVVNAVRQDENDPRKVTLFGEFFGEGTGSVSVEGMEGVEVVSWFSTEVKISLPEGTTSGLRYVKVVRLGDDRTGRLKAALVGTAPSAADELFETLPAPDYDNLGVFSVNETIGNSWQLEEYNGVLYAMNTSLSMFDSDKNLAVPLFTYTPETQQWSVEGLQIGDPSIGDPSGFPSMLMRATDDGLYLFNKSTYDLYRYRGSGSIETLGNYKGFERENLHVDYATMVASSDALYVVGLASVDEYGFSVAVPQILAIDLATGEWAEISGVFEARIFSAVEWVGESALCAGGTEGVTSDPLGMTLDATYFDGTFSKSAPSLPDSIRVDQDPATGSGVIPAGSTVVLADGSEYVLSQDSMVIAGLIGIDENAPDTYVFDASANEGEGAWLALKQRLDLNKIVGAGGEVRGGSFYVIGFDLLANGSTDEDDMSNVVFKRMKFELGQEDPTEPDDPEKPGGSEPGGGSEGEPGGGSGSGDGGSGEPQTSTPSASKGSYLAETGDTVGSAVPWLALACVVAAFVMAGAFVAQKRR